jgi:hypothetical protein
MLIHRCRNMFTTQLLATTATRTHRERRLRHLFYCSVTSQHTWRVPSLRVYGPLPSNACFSASSVLALSKYATLQSTASLPLRITEQLAQWSSPIRSAKYQADEMWDGFAIRWVFQQGIYERFRVTNELRLSPESVSMLWRRERLLAIPRT